MNPCTRPNASLSTFAIGATQLVVHESLEITSWRCGSYSPSLTPTVGILARRGQQYLARAPLQVQGRLVAGAELAGGLDHDVNSQPRDQGLPAQGRPPLALRCGGCDRLTS